MSAPEFHTLYVSDVSALTDDSVAVTLDVPDELSETFRFTAGQHVTVRAAIDGEDVRRSYSLCTRPDERRLRIGVKRIPNGVFSNFAVTELNTGDSLDVMPPVGEFCVEPEPGSARHYAAITAGSGITPVLSIVSTVLAVEPDSRVTVLYGNQATHTIMFLEELADLKDQYADRFQLIHVLSREPQLVELFHGRLDPDRLGALFESLVDAETVDEWFLCGPYDMVTGARAFLEGRGVAAEHVHDELFFDESIPEIPIERGATSGSQVTFSLDGRFSVVNVDPDGASILDHALQLRRDLPFACKGGVCATCKAKVVDGEVRMDQNWALVSSEVDDGLVLTCQAHPITDTVTLDYDV